MSDLFHALSSAARALDAQRFGLDVAGQNIANVNTPGYSRRIIDLAAVPPHESRSAGGGVEVLGVRAARAPLLEARLHRELPSASREAAVAEQIGVLEVALGTAGQSLDASLTDFYNAFAALAADPTSSVARQQVEARGASLALAFNAMATRMSTSRADADREIRNAVDQVNALAAEIATLNVAIASSRDTESEALHDRQSVALQSLSALIDIDVVPRVDGGVDVSVGNGRALVVGENAYTLSVTSAPPQGYATISSGSSDITAEITGGRIGGLTQVRDVLIPGYLNRLDELAYAVATDVNAAHRSGYDLDGNPGLDFFVPPAAPAGAAASLAVNAVVAGNPRLVAAAGAPSAGDNQIARAIAALQDAPMSGSTTRPIEAWSSLVFRVGTDIQTAAQRKGGHDEIVRQIERLRDQVSGVSLDEEATMMLRFQRAYEANARYFTAADEALTVLLNMVGG